MFEEFAAEQPDAMIVRIARRRFWLLTDPALVRGVLVDSGRCVGKGEGLRLASRLLGNGILTNDDPVSHKRNRRLINPAFSTARLRAYSAIMVEAAERAGARWRAGQVFDVTDEMARITLDVVGRSLLGDETDRDAKAITDSLDVAIKRFGLGFLPMSEKIFDSRLPSSVKIREAIATIRATVERIVSDHLRDREPRPDIVGTLLTASVDGEQLSSGQVQDETITLMLAGFETTANALAWAWWLLDQSPETAVRLRREIDDVLGDGRATYDDLSRLPYATAVIAETLRLRPPAWMLEREVREPTVIGTYVAPAGATILMSPWLLHHDSRSWGPDVGAFRPQRWLGPDGGFDPGAPGQPRGAYLPFGAGSRICIGENFAWAEAVLVLVTLARHWTLATEPGQEVGTWAAVTLRPYPGIMMRATPAPAPATLA